MLQEKPRALEDNCSQSAGGALAPVIFCCVCCVFVFCPLEKNGVARVHPLGRLRVVPCGWQVTIGLHWFVHTDLTREARYMTHAENTQLALTTHIDSTCPLVSTLTVSRGASVALLFMPAIS